MKEATMAASPPTSAQPRHPAGQFADWLEDATFLFMFFAGASLVAMILVLLIVL
jgi:hypothetical protein